MKTIFEIRPFEEYEKDKLIVETLHKQVKEFKTLKEALDFCINHKIIDLCYCVKCIVKNHTYDDLGNMTMQEILSAFENGQILNEYF